MGTFSKTYIQEKDPQKVLLQLRLFFNTGQEVELEQEYDWWFYPERKNDTIIVSQNNFSWTEVTFNFITGLYGYDEILRQISSNLQCLILLGYYQSTSGEARFAKFERGKLDLSIAQRVGGDSMLLIDNFGVTNEFQQKFLIPKIHQPFNDLDWDGLYKLYKHFGLSIFNEVEDDKYLHIENMIS
jgi:hypothetical protein